MSSLDFLQSLEHLRSPVLNGIFGGLTMLGSEEAYLALLVAVYLCVGHRFGFHLFVMFLLSVFSNSILKEAVSTQRPFIMYPDELHPLHVGTAGGPAFPSGHAQDSTVVWGIIAVRQGTRGWVIAAVLLALGIGFSRVYLQVHWPADVLGGWGIGALLVLGYLVVIGAWQKSNRTLSAMQGALIIVVVSALVLILGAGMDAALRAGGTLLGAGVGFILLNARGYDPQAPWFTQVLKVVVAVAVLLGLRAGIKVIIGVTAPAVYARYAAMGFTGTYLLPVFFSSFHDERTRSAGAPDEQADGH